MNVLSGGNASNSVYMTTSRGEMIIKVGDERLRPRILATTRRRSSCLLAGQRFDGRRADENGHLRIAGVMSTYFLLGRAGDPDVERLLAESAALDGDAAAVALATQS